MTPPPADVDALRDALRIHHPIMRSETGPFSGCRCGAVSLGQDVIAHVVGELDAALTAEVRRLRAVEAAVRAVGDAYDRDGGQVYAWDVADRLNAALSAQATGGGQ